MQKKSQIHYRLCGAIILGMLLTSCIAQDSTPSVPSATIVSPAQPTPTAILVPTATPIVASSASSTQNNVPAPFRCYLDGVAAKDLEATTACFADDALVIDVGRRIEGKDAIRRWLGNEVMGLKYEVESATLKQDGVVTIVKISFSSGGGFRARYDITFRDGRIVKMDLQYA